MGWRRVSKKRHGISATLSAGTAGLNCTRGEVSGQGTQERKGPTPDDAGGCSHARRVRRVGRSYLALHRAPMQIGASASPARTTRYLWPATRAWIRSPVTSRQNTNCIRSRRADATSNRGSGPWCATIRRLRRHCLARGAPTKSLRLRNWRVDQIGQWSAH
jgi:hypothetical protein